MSEISDEVEWGITKLFLRVGLAVALIHFLPVWLGIVIYLVIASAFIWRNERAKS